AGRVTSARCRAQPLARGVRADPRRGQQRAGWQQGGMGWADAVGGKGRLIFLYSPTAHRGFLVVCDTMVAPWGTLGCSRNVLVCVVGCSCYPCTQVGRDTAPLFSRH